MLKFILSSILILSSLKMMPQSRVFFKQKGDSVVFYLDCAGGLTTNNKATYERVALLRKESLGFKGNIVDYYYPKKTIALRATYKNGLYDGQIIRFYKSGKIKESGYYKNNIRDSIWNFYYSSGKKEKEIIYKKGKLKLMKYYKKNGKPVFLNGTGTYKGQSNTDPFSCKSYLIKGHVKNGLMTGQWHIYFSHSSATEEYNNGVFIVGHENIYNRNYHSPELSPAGFPYYKNISLLNFIYLCNKEGYDLWPLYNKRRIDKVFLVGLGRAIEKNIKLPPHFYALIEFTLKNGKIDLKSYHTLTNNKQTARLLKDLILSLNKWDKPKQNVSFNFFLPIFWNNGKLYF